MSIRLLAILGFAATVYSAKTENYTLGNVFLGGGGFVDGIQFHPKVKNVAYARTDMGGAYRWNSSSLSWTPITDMFGGADWNMYGIESIGLDPQDGNIVYIAAGTYMQPWAGNGYILRSRDQGSSWKKVALPFQFGGNEAGRSMGERLAVDPNKGSILFVGTRQNGLWKSSDSAKTWTQVPNFPISTTANGVGLGFVVFDPTTGTAGNPTQAIYVGVAQTNPSLYRSTDGGATWVAMPGAPTDMMPHHGVLSSDGSMYFTYADNAGPNGMTKGKVWKLNTATGVWKDISPVANTWYGYAGLAVDAQNPQTLMVSTMDIWPSNNQWRSTDGGSTWKGCSGNNIQDASLTPFLRWGGPADDSKTGSGNWEGALAIDPFQAGRVMYGTGAGIWGTDMITNLEKGTKVTWTPYIRGLEETVVMDLASPPSGADVISALGDVGGFVHKDVTISPNPGMLDPYYITQTSVDFAELFPSTVVRVGRGCSSALGSCGSISMDGGTTWTTFKTAPGGIRENGVVAISADGATIVWSPGGAAAYVSVDKGVSWALCSGLSGVDITVVADRVNSKSFYAVIGGTLYASTDGAKSFSAKAGGLTCSRLRAVFGLEGNLFVSGNNGLFRSTDGGATFSKIATTGSLTQHGFGKAAPGKSHPAIFVYGTIDGVSGFFRSDDIGLSWVRVNDDQHQWGGWPPCLVGDPKVYGRYYTGGSGRGIILGDIAGSAPTRISKPENNVRRISRMGKTLESSLGTIALFDLSGRCILRSQESRGNTSLDLSPLRPGLYIARSSNITMSVVVPRL